MWFSRTTSWPDGLEHPHERVADDRRAEVPDVHLLGHVRRRVVDDDPLGIVASGTPSRSSAATSATSAPTKVVERQVDEARPGDLGPWRRRRGRRRRAPPGPPRGVAAEPWRGQRAVGLGVGTVGRAHHRVDAGPPGDGVERRLQPVGEDVERISHRTRSLWPSAVRGTAAPTSRRVTCTALVAQGIEHRPPEPCAQVRILRVVYFYRYIVYDPEMGGSRLLGGWSGPPVLRDRRWRGRCREAHRGRP